MTNKYGCMTVERHTEMTRQGTFLTVLLDGVEVTHRCVMADDKVGRVVLVCRDPKHRDWKRSDIGVHLLPDDDGEVCKFDVSGNVDIVP